MDRDISRRTLLGGAAAISLLAPVLAACGSSEKAAEPKTSGPRRGGILKIGIGEVSTSETLDPVKVTSARNQAWYNNAIYDLLVDVDDKWNLIPQLAKSFEPSADLKTWTFTLREDVKFHNGAPFTADDAVYSILRHLDKAGGSPSYSRLSSVLAKNGLKTNGKYQFVATLKVADAFLPLVLSQKWFGMIPAGTTKFDGVGTGPFSLVSFKPGQSWEVKRNESYWQSGLPYLDGVQAVAITEPSTKVLSVTSGASDLIDDFDYTQVAILKQASGVAKIIEVPGAIGPLLAMNMQVAPFDNPKVREAIKLAYDRQQVINTAYQGRAVVTSDTPCPSTDSYYPKAVGIRGRDVAKAKSLLAEAGYPDGLKLKLYMSTVVAGALDFGTVFQQSVKDAGIDVQIKQWPIATYYDQPYVNQPFRVSWWYHRHPDTILPVAYVGDTSDNESHMHDAQFEQLLVDARATADTTKQHDLFEQAYQRIADDGGVIIPAYANRLLGVKNNVNGVQVGFQRDVVLTKTYLSS